MENLETTPVDLAEVLLELKAPRWRARASAAKMAASQSFMDTHLPHFSSDTEQNHVFDKLLRQLVHGVAIGDSKWQVRKVAVESAATILQARQDVLPADLFAKYMWGVLATCLDSQPEVQLAASHCVLQQLLPPSSHEHHVTGAQLCDDFIAAAIAEDAGLLKFSKLSAKSGSIGLDNLPDGDVLLDGITAAICLRLVPSSSDAKNTRSKGPDRIPLLLVVTAVAFEDANRRQSRVIARGLSKLLRCLGISSYRQSLAAMFNPSARIYLCGGLAEFYKDAGIIDEDIAMTLKTVKTVTLLKGLSLAFEAVDPDQRLTNVIVIGNQRESNSIKMSGLSQEELTAIQHIVKMLELPAEVTDTIKDQEKKSRIGEFIESAAPLLSILTSIINSTGPDLSLPEKLMEDLILCCAAFAGGDADDGLAASWTSKELHEHSLALLHVLPFTISSPKVPKNEEMKEESTLHLVSELLPSLLPRIKQIIHDSSGISGNEAFSKLSGDATVGSSIIAAYQMQWLIRQLQHPHLGPHCQLVMPCVLTALDHYSPEVKRQAMRTFIHLGKNMSSTEFQWYKDAILDAVSRSLVGCGDLWPVAVKMAVIAVTRTEGKNSRSSWYRRIFSEMIEELERHRDEQGRIVVWLQEILPQVEAMGLVLVTYFKRLLPLLFYWLHTRDDTTCILTLGMLQTVITYTWPRVPAHTKRIWEEMMLTYRESTGRKLGPEIQGAVVEVCKKLYLCVGPAFEACLQQDNGDASIDELISSLKKPL